MWIRSQRVLCEEEKDGNGGGGSGGDGAPKYLTVDAFHDTLSKALTSMIKRELPKAVKEHVGQFDEKFTSLSESIAKLTAAPPADPPADKDKKPSTKDGDFERQIQALAQQLDQEKTARQAAEQERNQIEGQRKFDTARQSLAGALKDKAHPDYLDDWLNKLTIVEKRLSVQDDGSVTLRVKHAPFKGAPEQEEDLSLDQAVPILLGRPEEKKYQGAPVVTDQKGSKGPSFGTGGYKPNAQSGNPIERADAQMREMFGATLESALGNEPTA